jgi:hypothetical protein
MALRSPHRVRSESRTRVEMDEIHEGTTGRGVTVSGIQKCLFRIFAFSFPSDQQPAVY